MIAPLLLTTIYALGGIDASDLRVSGNPLLLAPRGGVMMVPIERLSTDDEWSEEIVVQLVLTSGRRVDLVGHVAWMEPIVHETGSSWSRPQSAMTIRSIRVNDLEDPRERMRTGAGPQLLVRLPGDGSGSMRIGKREIPLKWLDVPDSMPPISVGGTERSGSLEFMDAYDRPSTKLALEWWRWELLGERLGLEPPARTFDSIYEQMAADHVASIWRIAMTRLNKASRGVAAKCRDLLTETCTDDGVSIAAWITNPASINNLLQIVLGSKDDDDATMANAALGWADEQINQFTWIQQPYGTSVNIQIANPGHDRILTELVWSSGDDVPLGIRLEPHDVTGVNVDRTPNTMAAPFSRMDILNIVLKDHVQKFSLGDDVIRAKPPGPILGPFAPAWTLGNVRTRETPETAPDRVSWIQLRRIKDSWELYIECLTPDIADQPDQPLPDRLDDLNRMRGIEAVTILVGASGSDREWPEHRIVITSDEWRTYSGSDSSTLEIGIRRQDDRWFANMRIPSSWLSDGLEDLKIAAIRTHGGDDSFETAPTPCVPWDLDPKPAYIDLDAWDMDDEPSLRGARNIR